MTTELAHGRSRVRHALPIVLLCCLAQACIIDPGEQPPDAQPPWPDARPPWLDAQPPWPDAQPPLPDAQPPLPDAAPPLPPVPPSSFLSADEPEAQIGEEEEEEEEEEEDEELLPSSLGSEEVALASPGRADIYAVLGDGKILELNEFRGLQIIDVADPERPTRLGHVPIIGEPLELHVAGDQAIVVLNRRQVLEPTGQGLAFTGLSRAGIILIVDLSDHAALRVVSETGLTGVATTSRLLTRGGHPTLYVTFNEDDWFPQPDGSYEHRRGGVVQSFQLVDGALVARSRLVLTGFLGVVQAAEHVLLVGHRNATNDLAIIDIGAADGSMALRAQVRTNERLRSVMLRDPLLYAFSGPTALDGTRAELSVWNAANLDAPVLVDREEFSQFRTLHATTLLGDRAFAITRHYDELGARLHTFAIDPTGEVTIVGARDVASWSDFLHPIFDGTRLLGIGADRSTGNERLALTLYDSSDPTRPEPLLATALVTPAPGPSDDRSEATREERAITVLEDAVDVQAPTGEPETGLVLVPFRASWNDGGSQHVSGVQMFTFSSKTITRRGTLAHPAEPVRSFLVGDGLVASLSSRLLGVFTSELAAPVERGQVELVDTYVQLLAFGDYRLRVRSNSGTATGENEPRYLVEIIPASEPVNSAQPVSSFEVPHEAQLILMGDLLVTVTDRFRRPPDPGFVVLIETYDLSDPRAPRKLGELASKELPTIGGPYWTLEDPPRLHVLPGKLVFARRSVHYPEPETGIGCETGTVETITCAGEVGCQYLTGLETCFDLDTGAYCVGGLAQCTYLGNGQSDCTPKTADELGDSVWSYCLDARVSHPWRELELYVVDLADPAQPVIASRLATPENESELGVVAAGDALYVSLKTPVTVSDDPRPHARTFLRRIDLADPAQPVMGDAIDVPGELLAVHGSVLFTRHPYWGKTFIETAIAQLVLTGDEVQLVGYHRFGERSIEDLRMAANGLIAAKHDHAWGRPWGSAAGALDHTLSLLRPSAPPASGQTDLQGFQVLSENPLSVLPSLDDIIPGRLFLRWFGGRLMLDISNPAHPILRAFLPLDQGSGTPLYQDGKMFVPAGSHGIIEHDLDAVHLP